MGKDNEAKREQESIVKLDNLEQLEIGKIWQFTFAQIIQYTNRKQLTIKEHNSFLSPDDRLEWNILRDQKNSSYGEFLVFFPRSVTLKENSIFLVARAKKLNRKIFLTPWDKPDEYLRLADRSFVFLDSEAKRKLLDLSPDKLRQTLPLCQQCHDTGMYKEEWHNPNLSKKHDIDRYCTCRAGIELSYRGRIKRITKAVNT